MLSVNPGVIIPTMKYSTKQKHNFRRRKKGDIMSEAVSLNFLFYGLLLITFLIKARFVPLKTSVAFKAYRL